MIKVEFTLEYRGWADKFKYLAVFDSSTGITNATYAAEAVRRKYQNSQTRVVIGKVEQCTREFIVLGAV